MTPKAYSFRPSVALLRELKSLSAEQKLQWPDDANTFLRLFLKPEDLERWTRAQLDGKYTGERRLIHGRVCCCCRICF